MVTLIVPEHYKNPNLNYQKSILSAWVYKTCYIRDLMQQNQALGRQPDELLFPLVNNESLDVLIQKHADKNGISWGGVGVKE